MATTQGDTTWIKNLIKTEEKGSDGKEHWILETRAIKKNERHRIQVLAIGKKNDKPVKSVLLLGQTGSGKSLLLNGFINHIFDIKYDDIFRLKLEDQIFGENRDHTLSQTDYITIYLVYHQQGMLYNDCNFMFIDTPGFNDIRGEGVFANLNYLFMNDYGMNFLNCIGLVVKANENRSLKHQTKLLNAITSLLGKDCTNITRLLCTFSCGDTQAEDVVKKAGIHFEGTAKFENLLLCSLFGKNKVPDYVDHRAMWKKMLKDYSAFFEMLRQSPSVNVARTHELSKNLTILHEVKERLRLVACQVSDLMEELDKKHKELTGLSQTITNSYFLTGERCYIYAGEGRHSHNCKECGKACFKCNDPSNTVAYVCGVAVSWAVYSFLELAVLGLALGPIGTGVGYLASIVLGSVNGLMSKNVLFNTKDDCEKKCHDDKCKHHESDHEISAYEMVSKPSLASGINILEKDKYDELTTEMRSQLESIQNTSEKLKEKEKEADMELANLVTVTNNISNLGNAPCTPKYILEHLKSENDRQFFSTVMKYLIDRVSKISTN